MNCRVLLPFLLLSLIIVLHACNPEAKDIQVTAISLNKTEITLEKGASEILSVTFTPSQISDKTLTWVSTNPSVATVTDGIVIAQNPGKAEIIVKCGDLTDKCFVSVISSAKSVHLDKSSLSFKALNESERLHATVEPSNTTDALEWFSSDENVAHVSDDGLVTSISPGSAEIIAQCGKVSSKCTVLVEVSATSLKLDNTHIDLRVGETESLIASVEPTNTTDKLEWHSSNEDVVIVNDGLVSAISLGSATIHVSAGELSASCSVLVIGAVDLGLSVRWANANIGATSEEDSGDYYAWGEIKTKDEYTWSTYKWCYDGSSNRLTKYNDNASYGIVDNRTVLEASDDVAHVVLGENWRIPTETEWVELMSKCSVVWTTQNGVNGCKFTSKSNGNSIFIPASGWIEGKELIVTGARGDYWSSSLSSKGSCYAVFAAVHEDGPNCGVGKKVERFFGFAIRPVASE